MLTTAKKARMLSALKEYRRRYLKKNIAELDESGTRLMINHFLTDILGFISLEEIKTEYMIRGTYADYVIQRGGVRDFLVEVKALSLNLSEKHLRQVVNYGANEGIDWALLTNGRQFEFYKIIFDKPIDYRMVLSVDLTEATNLKGAVEALQYLHKDEVRKKSLDLLWNRYSALEPHALAGLLYSKPVLNFIRRGLKRKYKTKFEDRDVIEGINRILTECVDVDNVKQVKVRRKKKDVKPEERQTTVIKAHLTDEPDPGAPLAHESMVTGNNLN
jgi:hypothetical protein